MKTIKHYFLLFYFVIFCNLSFSQWSPVGQLPNLGSARISVVDSNIIWATGDFPAVPFLYRSVNGGISWTSIPTQGLPYFLTCIAAKDSLTAFVADVGSNNYVGGNAKLFKTNNAGQTWILIDSTGGTLGFFDDIVFSKSVPQFGLALSDPPNGAGNPFYLFKTTNGGVDWMLTNPPGVLNNFGLLNALFAIDPQFYGFQIININTNTADSYITSDGGANWYTGGEAMPLVNYGFGEDIVFNDDKLTGIMISIDYLPNIKRTTDGGVNWESVNTFADISGFCNASWVSGTNTVFICVQNSVSNNNILRSDDGGLTWASQNTAPVKNIKEIECVRYEDVVIAYSVSSSGEILKSRQTIQPLSVEEIGSSVPLNFILSQNYPNPFNPETKISFSITKKSFVTLNIYNALGSKISELVREEKEAGRYEIDFNASGLSTGIYFYGLKAGNFLQTKKMILLR